MLDLLTELDEAKFDSLSENGNVILRLELLMYLKKRDLSKKTSLDDLYSQLKDAFNKKHISQREELYELDCLASQFNIIAKRDKSERALNLRHISRCTITLKYLFKPCRKQVKEWLDKIDDFIDSEK